MTGDRPLRVLVIDDEPLLRRVLCRALGAHGHEAIEAATADSAYRTLTEHTVDVVLLDLQLGEMPGEVLYYTLVRQWNYLEGRIVFMSGALEAAQDRWPAELRACPAIPKPFGLDEMLGTIARVGRPAEHRKQGNGH